MWLIVTWWFNYTIIDAFKDGILSKVHNLIKCKKTTKKNKTTTTKKKKLKSVYTFNLEYKCTWILTIAIHIYKKTRLRDDWEIYDIDFIA